jgi:hypothetical protein|tara:strand:+ start:76 stop:456 length:381 start_codon:yes stop_codon:yes gene_type:complete
MCYRYWARSDVLFCCSSSSFGIWCFVFAGKKIDTSYHQGDGFYEIDVDIGSSKVAGAIMGLVKGYTKSLVIDLAYLLESHNNEELPEQVWGSCRFHRVDMEMLKCYPEEEEEGVEEGGEGAAEAEE